MVGAKRKLRFDDISERHARFDESRANVPVGIDRTLGETLTGQSPRELDGIQCLVQCLAPQLDPCCDPHGTTRQITDIAANDRIETVLLRIGRRCGHGHPELIDDLLGITRIQAEGIVVLIAIGTAETESRRLEIIEDERVEEIVRDLALAECQRRLPVPATDLAADPGNEPVGRSIRDGLPVPRVRSPVEQQGVFAEHIVRMRRLHEQSDRARRRDGLVLVFRDHEVTEKLHAVRHQVTYTGRSADACRR